MSWEKYLQTFTFYDEKNIADADADAHAHAHADAHAQRDLLALTGGTMKRTLLTMELQSRLFTTFAMSTQR